MRDGVCAINGVHAAPDLLLCCWQLEYILLLHIVPLLAYLRLLVSLLLLASLLLESVLCYRPCSGQCRIFNDDVTVHSQCRCFLQVGG